MPTRAVRAVLLPLAVLTAPLLAGTGGGCAARNDRDESDAKADRLNSADAMIRNGERTVAAGKAKVAQGRAAKANGKADAGDAAIAEGQAMQLRGDAMITEGKSLRDK